ncbi:MAG: methyltransferase family protein [Candidatus Hodarchaeota archaeon]
MLGRIELLLGFFGAWVIFNTLLYLLKRFSDGKLPFGSIPIEITNSSARNHPIGPMWARMTVTVGFGINSIIVICILFLCILNQWNNIPTSIVYDFPTWLNWIGLMFIWISYGWGTAVLYYNPNYTPLFSTLKKKYVLATRGPYKIIRHPMYIQKALFPFLLFLTTGVWLTLLGLISWFTLPSQAKAEEKILTEIFEDNYIHYQTRTGRFFPKIREIFQSAT